MTKKPDLPRQGAAAPDPAEALQAIVAWFDHAGISGYDPSDVYDRPVVRAVRRLAGTRLGGVWRRLDRAIQKRPGLMRSLLLQPKHENAWAVGLVLAAHCKARKEGLPSWPDDSEWLVDWLENNANRDYPGASWSYPFGYQSRVYFPAGTPWGIVTAECGHSLLDYAHLESDDRALALAASAATFLVQTLNRYETSQGTCLSYTPIDDFAIHNANASVGAFLARAASVLDRPEMAALAAETLRFTVAQQKDDGAFDYWADHQSQNRHVDNYHTGFVLRALFEFEGLGYDNATAALERGWEFYRTHFMGSDGRPITVEGSDIPVDIHACAESILCGSQLSARFPDALDWAESGFRWTEAHLRNPDGSYGYGVFDYGVQPFAYTRWGEAWMLRALTQLVGSRLRASESQSGR